MISYDESEFEAGTDNPCYQDDNITIKCNWQDEDAYPFGYWEVNFDGEEKFVVGDNGSMHSDACGKAAREYFISYYMSEVEEDAETVNDAIDELLDTLKMGNYTYNSEEEEFVSEDGSDTISVYDYYYDNIEGNLHMFGFEEDYIESILFKTAIGKINPTFDEIENHFEQSVYNLADEYNWETSVEINEGLQEVGSNFDDFFYKGRLQGRIWTYDNVISFYEEQQPTQSELVTICKNLSLNDEINTSFNELMNFYIVYRNFDNEKVKACTVLDYIEGNNDDDEEYVNSINPDERKGSTFIPHLASQKDKRDYFAAFMANRDKNVYAPIEKKYGSLAAYYAQKYQESVKRIINNVINEHINRKRRDRV